jgi:hypothetical protein
MNKYSYYLRQASLCLGGGFTHTKTLSSSFFERKIQQRRPPLLELFIIKKKKLYKKGATTMNKAPKGRLKPEEG